MYIASRGYGKSFLLAVYCLLRTILIPDTKIVIVGAAFRQSKIIFDYMGTIWKNAHLLRSVCSDKSGPKASVDKCTFDINDSWTIAVPLGQGDKIRGYRAHVIICDEFNCLGEDTLVETKQGLVRIGDQKIDHSKLDICTGDQDTPYEKLSKHIITPPSDVYKVTFDNGYIIKCSLNHPIMSQDGWKKPLELTTSDYVESNNNYSFPDKATISEKTAWLMGMLVSEGSINDKTRIAAYTTDKQLAKFICKKFDWKLSVRKAYKDKRGWNCKKSYMVYTDDQKLREYLYSLGLSYSTAIDKKIPNSILQQPRHIVMAFLEGLFEGDGSAFLWSDDKGVVNNRLGCAYYSVSEILCRDVQVILNKLGYDPYINNRTSEISDNLQWFVRLNGLDAYDFVSQLNIKRFKAAFDNCYIPTNPKNYSWDKSRKKWKINIKHLGKTIQKRFNTEKEARQAVQKIKSNRYRKVISVEKLDEKEVLYDYHLPITHSFYAGSIRNHNSVPINIYETVVAGFAAVSAKPRDNVQKAAKRAAMIEDGVWDATQEEGYNQKLSNQSILSGTCGYDFESFADYWKKYRALINSKGDLSKLMGGPSEEEKSDSDDDNALPDYMKDLSWKEFCIVRIPYEIIPKGFMDDATVSRARATMHSSTYDREYGAVFSSDSSGFFKRRSIERATAHDKNCESPNWPPWCPSVFDAVVMGDKNKQYVMGIDPASERDNFAIVILELYPEHHRVVYSWTTNKKDFQARRKVGLTPTTDYYSFCCRKIRDLMKIFPTVRIGIDSQGGGYTIAEGLADHDKLQEGEKPLLPIIEEGKEKDTDDLPGDHIIELMQFANAEWNSRANHDLKKDIEDKVLLFPRFDSISLSIMSEKDKVKFEQMKEKYGESNARVFDTLEDAVMEIEELKEELTMIVHEMTPGGRERFDTPQIKMENGKKGRLRKDRYSALVIGNSISRSIQRTPVAAPYSLVGTYVGHEVTDKRIGSQMYVGSEYANKFDVSIFSEVNGVYNN